MLHSTCPQPPIAHGLPATREGISGSTPNTVHNSPTLHPGWGRPKHQPPGLSSPQAPRSGAPGFPFPDPVYTRCMRRHSGGSSTSLLSSALELGPGEVGAAGV